ncbi:MAG: dTMP kinase [Deltaproteobacteria bacterium]|nr:dTMP kinase [Deltaproteobacteria bacterium]
MFLVLEGLDGAGTTTQSARLVQWLGGLGLAVQPTREPTGGPVGRLIRTTLRGEPGSPRVESLPWLFAADRADHLHRLVEPALARGAWVVSDRYLHSSLAYQSLTQPMEQVLALNATFRAPDLTLFLDVSVDACLRRIEARTDAPREIYEERERLERISALYQQGLDLLIARGDRVVRLEGELSVDEVSEAVRARVAPLVGAE